MLILKIFPSHGYMNNSFDADCKNKSPNIRAINKVNKTITLTTGITYRYFNMGDDNWKQKLLGLRPDDVELIGGGVALDFWEFINSRVMKEKYDNNHS